MYTNKKPDNINQKKQIELIHWYLMIRSYENKMNQIFKQGVW